MSYLVANPEDVTRLNFQSNLYVLILSELIEPIINSSSECLYAMDEASIPSSTLITLSCRPSGLTRCIFFDCRPMM